MSDVTAGSYLGSQADDPNAELRKIFSEWGNQQDGLGTILNYCQTESGFTVGSSDTTGFIEKIQEFSGVVDRKSSSMLSPGAIGSMPSVVVQVMEFLDPLPDKSKIEKFNLSLFNDVDTSLVHFCIHLEGNSLLLYIPEVRMIGSAWFMTAGASFEIWEINRYEMSKRADELVVKCRLKNRIDDWTKQISSDGY
ncbi:hypothetical protein BGX23_010046 [Mortierella sp. AD031]|nr:hypothetical protein BGX23_010046 [Mortierella sp. AD031]